MNGKFERNELGDIILPEHDLDINSPEMKYWEWTYIFEYYSDSLERFVPCFDITKYERVTVDAARLNDDFLEVEIYKFPLEMIYRDEMIYHRNFEESLLNTFFFGVFKAKHPAISTRIGKRYSRFIMKRSHYEIIMNFINDNRLLPFRDVLLEIIANGQELYLENVFYSNEKSLKKKINTVKRNVGELWEIFELSTREESERWDSRRELKTPDFINFVYNDRQFKISDYFVINDLICSYKDKLNDSDIKNWRYMLDRFSRIYDEEAQELKFRERYVNALRDMFKYLGAFGRTITLTNDHLRFIDQFLVFSGIYPGGIDEAADVRIKHIRNWLKRNKLEQQDRKMEFAADRAILDKYFDRDFLELPMDNKIDEEVLGAAGFLILRFGLEEKKFEVTHIVKCLSQVIWLIVDQVSSGLLNQELLSSEFEDYKRFINNINSGTELTSASFTFGEQTISFDEHLPLTVIADGLSHYCKYFKEEAENDIVQSHIVKEIENGQVLYNPNQKPVFQKPKDQLVVRFVGQMYQFLLNEFPPDNQEFSPKYRYYNIIAQTLLKTHYFRMPNKDEEMAIEQIAKWHSVYLSR